LVGSEEKLLRIATYRLAGQRRVGMPSADGTRITAFDIEPALAQRGALSLIEQVAAGAPWPALRGEPVALADVQLEAPIPLPRRNLFCVGRNYHAHAKELRDSVFKDSPKDTQSWPIVFTKVPECVIGQGADVQLPGAVSTQIDYEAEGKSFDTFCPMGPWLVTADEIDATDTRVRCWVNDELRQDARTADLIFDIATLIETCSRGITLYPGDLIATGTPAGVGMALTPPRWLRHGDVVRIEIDGIGTLSNRFVEG
jgi:2-keto-4-pentenoate hydratase/2-oxohepta-3-ene-1,7-dioic acid hydratase in catechol pathway